jgi:hypothetical protein
MKQCDGKEAKSCCDKHEAKKEAHEGCGKHEGKESCDKK